MNVESLAAAREVRAGAQARAENQQLRRVEMGRVSGERFECPPPVLPQKQGFSAHSVGAVAEESGRLEEMLTRVADVYDREVQVVIKRFLAVLEPAQPVRTRRVSRAGR